MGPVSNFSTASMTSFFTAVSMAAATVWRECLAQPVPATRMYFPTKIGSHRTFEEDARLWFVILIFLYIDIPLLVLGGRVAGLGVL